MCESGTKVAKPGVGFSAKVRAGAAGAIVSVAVANHGRGYSVSGTACTIEHPPDDALEAEVCAIEVDRVDGEGAITGLQLAGAEFVVDHELNGERITWGGTNLPGGTFGYEFSRGWSPTFTFEQLLAWPALVPAVTRLPNRTAVVPSALRGLLPAVVLDSACAEAPALPPPPPFPAGRLPSG